MVSDLVFKAGKEFQVDVAYVERGHRAVLFQGGMPLSPGSGLVKDQCSWVGSCGPERL